MLSFESDQIDSSSVQPNTSNPYRRRFPQRTNSYAFRFRGSGQDGEIIRDDLRAWSTKLHLHAPPNLYPRIKVPYRTIFMVSLINLVITFFYRAYYSSF